LLTRYTIPAILWITISTILLTLPGSSFPKENWLSDLSIDKWIHLAMFGLMVFLLCWAFYKSNLAIEKKRGIFIWSAVACFVYGTAMEFIQEYCVVNRSFDVGDILADGAGSAAGLFYSIKRFIKK
jgi:VanZ family protein